jgi:hypothetical protein
MAHTPCLFTYYYDIAVKYNVVITILNDITTINFHYIMFIIRALPYILL